MMSIKCIGFLCAMCVCVAVAAQDTSTARFTIVDMNKDSGTVLIRNYKSAWMKFFKPEALEFAELKIGDTIEVSNSLQQVKRVNKRTRRYPLMDVSLANPCCQLIGADQDTTQHIYVAANPDGGRFRFELPDTIAAVLKPGFRLFTSPTHGYAMLSLPAQSDTSHHIVYGFPILATNTH